MKIQIKRSDLYTSKGQLEMSSATEDFKVKASNELNETLANIITKKFVGGTTDENS